MDQDGVSVKITMVQTIMVLTISAVVEPPDYGQRWPGYQPPPRREFVEAVKDQMRRLPEDASEGRSGFDLMWWTRR